MNTIKNYIKYFKDVTFDESPFNDVDNLILCSLTYLDFESFINDKMTIGNLGKLYFQVIDYKSIKNQPFIVRRTIDNFELLFNGKRYRDIIISDYVKIVDKEKQFGAMTFHLPNNLTYVAFEGTDDSVIGWKEDFDMMYKFPVPSQKMAIDYINKVIKFSYKKVIVGGHSKGGNLAMTASMYARGYIKRKIVKVYNNDGPGFRKAEIESKEYHELLPKLKMFIPEEATIGLLLRNKENYTVIKSSGKSFLQHDINNWNCYGPILIKGTIKEESKSLEKRILDWLEIHNDEKRKQFVDTIFNILAECEITELSQLRRFNLTRVNKLIKMSRELDKDAKDLLVSAFKIIFAGDDRSE